MKRFFLFAIISFLASAALAQSQLIKGTIVPAKKKAVLILPVAEKKDTVPVVIKKDTIPVAIKKVAPLVVTPPRKTNGESPLRALDTTVLKNYDSSFVPVKTNLKAQYVTGTLVPKVGTSKVLKPVPEDSIKAKSVYAPLPSQSIKKAEDNAVAQKAIVNTDPYSNYSSPPEKTVIKETAVSVPLLSSNQIKSPLDVLDTTKFIIPGVKDDIGKYSLPPEPKQERKEQLLTGVLEAKPGASASVLPIVISEPVIDNSRQTQVAVSKNSNTKKVFTGGSDPLNNYSLPPEATAEKAISAPGLGIIQIKSPLDAVDTNIMVVKEGDAVSKYSLPPQVQPKLKAQEVTGIIEAKLGAPTSVEPVAVASETMAQESFPLFPPQRDTLATLDTSGVSTNKNATFRSPLDALDTTQMEYDASSIITTYTTPSQLNAKAQMVKGVLVPVVGTPVVVEPLSPDSIARRDADTVKIETPMPEKINSDLPVKNNADNVVNDVAVQNINSNVIADTTTAKMNVDAPFGTNASATDNVKSNFYVAQNGKFSVRFSSSLFYLNVSQLGKVIDYEILSNGRITSNAKSKVVQVGNIKVDYNLDGTMASIAGVPVAYTYDGRVNRVGNVNINYTYGGAMDKVGNVSIFYNGNSTVERIATYRVGYNDKKMVVGIDDSNGLVVFKP